jgi:hypothetical protein
MKLLVSGCTKTMREWLPKRPDRLGILYTPPDGHRIWWPVETTWACDNGCFNGLNPPEFLRMLAKLCRSEQKPAWVACPDSVANAEETERLFNRWCPMLHEIGLPVAFVLQDGLEKFKWNSFLKPNWHRIAAVFVGGSTGFKLSEAAFKITKEAREQGKLVHFGRVNTLRRILYIARAVRDGKAWCDTIDGGSAVKWGDTNLPKLIRWMDKASVDKQQLLFLG